VAAARVIIRFSTTIWKKYARRDRAVIFSVDDFIRVSNIEIEH